jgi:hypothetical protein
MGAAAGNVKLRAGFRKANLPISSRGENVITAIRTIDYGDGWSAGFELYRNNEKGQKGVLGLD